MQHIKEAYVEGEEGKEKFQEQKNEEDRDAWQERLTKPDGNWPCSLIVCS